MYKCVYLWIERFREIWLWVERFLEYWLMRGVWYGYGCSRNSSCFLVFLNFMFFSFGVLNRCIILGRNGRHAYWIQPSFSLISPPLGELRLSRSWFLFPYVLHFCPFPLAVHIISPPFSILFDELIVSLKRAIINWFQFSNLDCHWLYFARNFFVAWPKTDKSRNWSFMN